MDRVSKEPAETVILCVHVALQRKVKPQGHWVEEVEDRSIGAKDLSYCYPRVRTRRNGLRMKNAFSRKIGKRSPRV